MKILDIAPRNILLINVSRIGDTVLCSPSIRAIAEKYPNAKIDFLGHPKRYHVAEHLPWLSHVGAISKKRAPFLQVSAFLFAKKKYDLAVVWGQDKALVRYALRVAKNVIAWSQNDSLLDAKLTVAVPVPSDENLPLSRWQISLLAPLLSDDIDKANLSVAYQVLPEEVEWAEQWMKVNNIRERTRIGLIVESFPTMPHRDWAIENFVKLNDRISSHYPNSVFLLFGVDISNEKIKSLQNVLQDKLIILSGIFSIRESAALMSQLNLYIGLDTGPSHIVSALGVPAVVLFHCMRRGSLVLSPKFPKRLTMVDHPCSSEYCSFETSMSAINPDQVFLHVCAMLDAKE